MTDVKTLQAELIAQQVLLENMYELFLRTFAPDNAAGLLRQMEKNTVRTMDAGEDNALTDAVLAYHRQFYSTLAQRLEQPLSDAQKTRAG